MNDTILTAICSIPSHNYYTEYAYGYNTASKHCTRLMHIIIHLKEYTQAEMYDVLIECLKTYPKEKINQSNERRDSVLDITAKHLNETIYLDAFRLLLKSGAESTNAIFFIAKHVYAINHLEALRLFIQIKGNDAANLKNSSKGTLLGAVCEDIQTERHIEAIQFLLESGADVNAEIYSGHSALSLACFNYQCDLAIKAIQVLLDAGANVNTKSSFFFKPLTVLIRFFPINRNRADAIRLLISRGADVHGSQDGINLLTLTAANTVSEDGLEVMKLLIQHNLDINAGIRNGHTILTLACHAQNYCIDVVRFLLEIRVQAKEADVFACLSMNADPEICRLLLMNLEPISIDIIKHAARQRSLQPFLIKYVLDYLFIDPFVDPDYFKTVIRLLSTREIRTLRKHSLQHDMAAYLKYELCRKIPGIANRFLYKPSSLRSNIVCVRHHITPQIYQVWLKEKRRFLEMLNIYDYASFRTRLSEDIV